MIPDLILFRDPAIRATHQLSRVPKIAFMTPAWYGVLSLWTGRPSVRRTGVNFAGLGMTPIAATAMTQ